MNAPENQGNDLIRAAWGAIRNTLEGVGWVPSAAPRERDQWDQPLGTAEPTGAFVTLYKQNKKGTRDLRGCIGRHVRVYRSLNDEISDCAIESAFRDPRFSELEPGELLHVTIEISLLQQAHPVAEISELDPKKWGVIVRRGVRQATLLPGIEGVDSVAQQLSIVRRKAGIHQSEKIDIYKFWVDKIHQNEGAV